MNKYCNSNWHKHELYRSSDDKVIAGVCAGLANHFGFATIWARLAAVMAFFIFNGLAIVAYIVLAVIMKKAPTGKQAKAEKKASNTVYSRSAEAAKARMADIDERLANVERYVTSNRFRLQKQFEELR